MYGLVGPLVSIPLLVLATDACRSRFQSSASTFGSNDPIGTLRVVPAWLRDLIASQVGRFAVSHWADVCRCEFDSTALAPGSIEPIGAFWMDSGWLRDVCVP